MCLLFCSLGLSLRLGLVLRVCGCDSAGWWFIWLLLFWWVVSIFVWVYFCLWLVSCLLLGFRLFSLFLVVVGLRIWCLLCCLVCVCRGFLVNSVVICAFVVFIGICCFNDFGYSGLFDFRCLRVGLHVLVVGMGLVIVGYSFALVLWFWSGLL